MLAHYYDNAISIPEISYIQINLTYVKLSNGPQNMVEQK